MAKNLFDEIVIEESVCHFRYFESDQPKDLQRILFILKNMDHMDLYQPIAGTYLKKLNIFSTGSASQRGGRFNSELVLSWSPMPEIPKAYDTKK
jgi:hypothetical protein